MASDEFKQGMVQLYQGELFGEVFFEEILPRYEDAERRYKLSVMLQLETETKARLRPAMMLLGLDLGEQGDSRKKGLEFADAIKGLDWRAAMTTISDVLIPIVERYKEIEALAPPEHRELAASMVIHEQSLLDFARLEAAGEVDGSADAVVAQLNNKLPLP